MTQTERLENKLADYIYRELPGLSQAAAIEIARVILRRYKLVLKDKFKHGRAS